MYMFTLRRDLTFIRKTNLDCIDAMCVYVTAIIKNANINQT